MSMASSSISANISLKALLFDVGGVCVLSPLLASMDTLFKSALPTSACFENYEVENKLPLGYINYNIYNNSPNGAWHKLERGEINLDDAFFKQFTVELNNGAIWQRFHEKLKPETPTSSSAPSIDGKKLFWDMMDISRTFDPFMIPAIRKLRESGRFKLGAVTNNIIFPPNHPYGDDSKIRSLFDVFVSSAESGMRKPEARIYEHALKQLALGIEDANNVVFVDDLGSNLKAAKNVGMITVQVKMRETWKAVRQLEIITGMQLLEDGINENSSEMLTNLKSKF